MCVDTYIHGILASIPSMIAQAIDYHRRVSAVDVATRTYLGRFICLFSPPSSSFFFLSSLAAHEVFFCLCGRSVHYGQPLSK